MPRCRRRAGRRWRVTPIHAAEERVRCALVLAMFADARQVCPSAHQREHGAVAGRVTYRADHVRDLSRPFGEVGTGVFLRQRVVLPVVARVGQGRNQVAVPRERLGDAAVVQLRAVDAVARHDQPLGLVLGWCLEGRLHRERLHGRRAGCRLCGVVERDDGGRGVGRGARNAELSSAGLGGKDLEWRQQARGKQQGLAGGRVSSTDQWGAHGCHAWP